jgi:signal transduction histidine kinase
MHMPSERAQLQDLIARFTPSIPARLWIKNSAGAYVYVNQRLVDDFGIPCEQWLGSTDEQLFPDLARAYRRNDLAVLSSGQPLQTTDLVLRRGAQEFAFVLRFPLDILDEHHLGALAIDLTTEVSGLIELQRVQDQRYQNERLRALGELASGLAHDLSNSLNAAMLRLDVVRQKADPILHPDIDAVIRSITNAAERVKGVRNFARAGHEHHPSAIDLGPLVRQAIEMVEMVIKPPTLLGGRVRIECALPDSLPPISAVATELQHVIANLLLNARDAMPEGGTVTITAKVTDRVELSVADEGAGIAQENLDRIFSPFFTTKPTGSGLGLSMAQDVMTRLGGEISARNRPEGGAEFTLRFPRTIS